MAIIPTKTANIERQYVGARYVPIFANPIEWDINSSYEPLTIVTYLNSTYTSKIQVPPGTEITNTAYWVRTSSFNAQLEQLTIAIEGTQTQVGELQTEQGELLADITALKQSDLDIQNSITGPKPAGMRNIIFIGDSYGNTGQGTQYPEIIKTKWGLTASNCLYAMNGGSGFAGTGTIPGSVPTFGEALKQLLDNAGDTFLQNTTHIVFAGGANDLGQSFADISTGFTTAATQAARCPNATVYCLWITRYVGRSEPTVNLTRSFWQSLAQSNNMLFGRNVYTGLAEATNFYDGLHPTAAAQPALASYIQGALRDINIRRDTNSSVCRLGTWGFMWENIEDGVYHLNNRAAGDFSGTFTQSSARTYDLGAPTSLYCKYAAADMPLATYRLNTTGYGETGNENDSCSLFIRNGHMIAVYQYLNEESITSVFLPTFSVTANFLELC